MIEKKESTDWEMDKLPKSGIYFIDDKLYYVVGFAENGDPLLANEETIFEILS